MEGDKYKDFIYLLDFSNGKYSIEKVFNDFITMFAIIISNKVSFNQRNLERYLEVYNAYTKEEQLHFKKLMYELALIFINTDGPYDVLGDIYKKISNNNSINNSNTIDTKVIAFSKLSQGVIQFSKNMKYGRMLEVNCDTGGMILAYARSLKMFGVNHKTNINTVATDTNLLKVYMAYIQLYYYDISAIVVHLDNNGKENMRLYTPEYYKTSKQLKAA